MSRAAEVSKVRGGKAVGGFARVLSIPAAAQRAVRALLAVPLVAAICAAPALAEIPHMINYQGRLVDEATGAPLAGPHAVQFELYDEPVGGDTLWTESQTVSADSVGVFSCMLGRFKPVSASFESPCWLAVEVDGQALEPRRELASVPYAFFAREAVNAVHASHASRADSLGGEGPDAFAMASHNHDDRYFTQTELQSTGTINQTGNPVDWTKLKNVPAGLADGTDDVGAGDGYSLDAADGDPTDAVYVDNSGNVGIGTSSPARKVHIEGDGPRVLLEAITGNPEVNFKLGSDTAPQVWALYKESVTGDLRFYQGGDRVTIKNGTGAVGIGTSNPVLGKLQVENVPGTAVYAASNDGIGLFGFSQNGTGVSGASNNGRAGDFTGDVYISGDLGIGTASPAHRLDVNGEVNTSSTYMVHDTTVLDIWGPGEVLLVGPGAGGGGIRDVQRVVAVGDSAGYLTYGHDNTFVGYYAGYMCGTQVLGPLGNTFVGYKAGSGGNTADSNTFLGSLAGQRHVTGEFNLFVGEGAGSDHVEGSKNTVVGSRAGGGNVSGSGNLFLGFGAGANETGSNKLYIANGEDAADVLIYGDFSSGRLGIGTLAPDRKVHIKGEGPRLLIEASAGSPEVNFKTAGDAPGEIWAIYKHSVTEDLRFYQNGDRVTIQNSTGNMGIGTTNPGGYKLYVNGAAYATSWSHLSDARLKMDQLPIGDALSKVTQLNGLSFLWRTNEYPDRGLPEGRHFGLVAQDVEQVLPEIVNEGTDGEKAVAYSELIPLLVESVKQLKAETDQLRAENTELRTELVSLRQKLDDWQR